MDHNSNSRDSGDDFRSSTVISVARRQACFATLVDELVVRIHSLVHIPDHSTIFGYVAGTDSFAIWSDIVTEADRWWSDHAFDRLTQHERRSLMDEVLRRDALEGALVSLGVCSGDRLALLRRSDIEMVQAWDAALVTKHGAIAQALALIVLAPRLASEPIDEIGSILLLRVEDGAIEEVNSTLLVCLGLLQNAPEKYPWLIFEVLLSIARRSDLEAVNLLGGLLGRLWPLLPEQTEKWLSENCGRLSRRVFRLAVERLSAQKRRELTQKWKDLRPHRQAKHE